MIGQLFSNRSALMFLGVVAVTAFGTAASFATPATMPAAGTAAAPGIDRKATDGTPLPPVTFEKNAAAAPPRKDAGELELAEQLLLGPPEGLGKRLYSSKASAKLLELRMTRKIEIEQPADRAARPDGERPVVRIIDELDAPWFSWGQGSADVIGFDLQDGVIVKLVLYFRTAAAVNRARMELRDLKGTRWECIGGGAGSRFVYSLPAAARYIVGHPETPAPIRRAMLDRRLVEGMTIEQAIVVLGHPDSIEPSGEGETFTWQMATTESWRATVHNGKITSLGHSVY